MSVTGLMQWAQLAVRSGLVMMGRRDRRRSIGMVPRLKAPWAWALKAWTLCLYRTMPLPFLSTTHLVVTSSLLTALDTLCPSKTGAPAPLILPSRGKPRVPWVLTRTMLTPPLRKIRMLCGLTTLAMTGTLSLVDVLYSRLRLVGFTFRQVHGEAWGPQVLLCSTAVLVVPMWWVTWTRPLFLMEYGLVTIRNRLLLTPMLRL